MCAHSGNAPMSSAVIVWGVYRKRVVGSMSSSAGCGSSSQLDRRDTGKRGGSGGSSALPRLESAAIAPSQAGLLVFCYRILPSPANRSHWALLHLTFCCTSQWQGSMQGADGSTVLVTSSAS